MSARDAIVVSRRFHFHALLRARWRRARRAQLVSGLCALRRESARVSGARAGARESTRRGAAGAAVLYTVLRQQKKLSASVLHLLARDRATVQTRRVFGRWCSHTARCARANADAVLHAGRDAQAHAQRRLDVERALRAWRTSVRKTRFARDVLGSHARRRARHAASACFRLWRRGAIDARDADSRTRVVARSAALAQARSARRLQRRVVREWRGAMRSVRAVRTRARVLLRRARLRARTRAFRRWAAHVAARGAARARRARLRVQGCAFARHAARERTALVVREWTAVIAAIRCQRLSIAAVGARRDSQRLQRALRAWSDAARYVAQEERRCERRTAAASRVAGHTQRRVLTTTLDAWWSAACVARRHRRIVERLLVRSRHLAKAAGWSGWVVAVRVERVRRRARTRAARCASRLAAQTAGASLTAWRRYSVRRRHLCTLLRRARAHAAARAQTLALRRWRGATRRATRARDASYASIFRRWQVWTARRHQRRRGVAHALRRATRRGVAALWQAWVYRVDATKLRRRQASVMQQRGAARAARLLRSCATAWRRAAVAQRGRRGATSAVVQLAERRAFRRAAAQWRTTVADRRAAARSDGRHRKHSAMHKEPAALPAAPAALITCGLGTVLSAAPSAAAAAPTRAGVNAAARVAAPATARATSEALLEEACAHVADDFAAHGVPLRSARLLRDVGSAERPPPQTGQSAIGAVQAALDTLARLREEHAAYLRASPWPMAGTLPGWRDAPSRMSPAPFPDPAARAYTVVCRGTIESVEEERGAIGGALSSTVLRQQRIG